MTNIFNPATRIMNSLTYPKKIALLGVITVLTITFLYTGLYIQMNQKIVESRMQLQGLEKLLVVNKAIQLAQQHRGLSSAVHNGDIRFQDEYIIIEQKTKIAIDMALGSLDAAMFVNSGFDSIDDLDIKLGESRKHLTLEENFAEHTRIISQLKKLSLLMGDHYHLITDGELFSYYLIVNIMSTIPNITETLGQLRGVVLGVISSGRLSNEQRIHLNQLEARLENEFNTLEFNTKKMRTYSSEISGEVIKAQNILFNTKNDLLYIVHNDILNGKLTTEPLEFYRGVTEDINRIYSLMYQTFAPSLKTYIQARIKNAIFTLLLTIGIAGIFLLATLYFLVGLYLALVRNIRHVDFALSEYAKGNLGERIYLNTQDEMRTISQSFNSMADKLNQVLEENEEEKKFAEKANMAKSEFLSSMSHELRTPLNAIMGFSQLLEVDREIPLSEKQKEWLGYISSGGRHLLNLINQVLELSAIEAGKLELSIESIQLIDVIDDVVSLTASLSSKANIPVHLSSDLAVNVSADYTKLKQVFINLIGNGIKYNSSGGSVSIDWYVTEKAMVRINITDTGIGIAQENHRKVFDPFNRLGKENSTVEGTGIGLVVTKNLVEMMGGKIGFYSVEGEGSTFWFELPVAEPIDMPVNSKISKILEISDVSNFESKNVLYVEDNAANRIFMQAIFEDTQHCTLHMAETGEMGLDIAQERDFDLLLIDINLPGMNGKELTQTLRETDTYKHKPIVAVTAAAMTHDVESAEGLFDQYITKPFDLPQLMDVLNRYLK